jgi:hypothetical protein
MAGMNARVARTSKWGKNREPACSMVLILIQVQGPFTQMTREVSELVASPHPSPLPLGEGWGEGPSG